MGRVILSAATGLQLRTLRVIHDRLIFEREFLLLVKWYLACRWKVMGNVVEGDVYSGGLQGALLGMIDHQFEMRLMMEGAHLWPTQSLNVFSTPITRDTNSKKNCPPSTNGSDGDYYDESLEIHGVAPDARLSVEKLQAIKTAGFGKVYVNHTDKWETHYTFAADVSAKPWRVSYPHKRGDTGSIWVEEVPSGWPNDWLKTGYVTKKEPA